jgi:hypothetical protein
VRSASHPDGGPPAAAPDAELAAAVRLLHRRHGWSVTAFWALIAFLLSYGAYLNAVSETGTDSGSGPFIMRVIIAATGALTVASLVIIAVDSRRLRRLPAEVRTSAAGVAKHHPVRAHAHRYPPRHRVSWMVGWVGMALIVFVAVICFSGTVDGIGYLAGAGKSATFTGQSYDQSCGSLRGGCQTVTDGVLTRNGVSVSTTWPDEVPLGQPFAVRESVWNWGVGGSLIDGDGTAVAAIILSLLLDAAAVAVLVLFARMIRNWLRHRRRPASGLATG